MGCPKSSMWESEGQAWSEDEKVSPGGSREGNVCNDALHVIGLYGPGGKISLFLQGWELTKVGPGRAVPAPSSMLIFVPLVVVDMFFLCEPYVTRYN